ncbi:AAA family ATPase [Catalinimonas sp. 4WD22]|uniref:AAA family ATPase n=1 Tax=Catalinimonas locisalis TaxID=3133978 RepID=UPI003100DE02
MEAVIFVGIQGAGKSTFYKQRFFNSHVRISLDLLNTRNKQRIFMETCFSTQSRFVVDNTHPTKSEREVIIQNAKANGYTIIGYFFDSFVKEALARNEQREGKEKIPVPGILGCYKKLERPDYAEGFDMLYLVKIVDGKFVVETLER